MPTPTAEELKTEDAWCDHPVYGRVSGSKRYTTTTRSAGTGIGLKPKSNRTKQKRPDVNRQPGSHPAEEYSSEI